MAEIETPLDSVRFSTPYRPSTGQSIASWGRNWAAPGGRFFFFRELGIHLSTCLVLIKRTGGRVPLGCQMELYEFLDWLCTLHVSQLNLDVPVCFISAATPTRNALDLDPVDARLMKIDMPAKFAPAPRASSRRQAHSLRWLAPLDAFRKQVTVAFQ